MGGECAQSLCIASLLSSCVTVPIGKFSSLWEKESMALWVKELTIEPEDLRLSSIPTAHMVKGEDALGWPYPKHTQVHTLA